jgi:hypothetical protein
VAEDHELAAVVELFPGIAEEERLGDERPLTTDHPDRERMLCRHRLTRLDTQARRVYCRECDVEVPAFDVLEYLSRDTEHYLRVWRQARNEAKHAEERLAGLDRREKNTKARIRRAQKQAGPTSLEVAARITDLVWRLTCLPDRRHGQTADEVLDEVLEWLRDLIETDEDDFPDGSLQTIERKFVMIFERAQPATSEAALSEPTTPSNTVGGHP